MPLNIEETQDVIKQIEDRTEELVAGSKKMSENVGVFHRGISLLKVLSMGEILLNYTLEATPSKELEEKGFWIHYKDPINCETLEKASQKAAQLLDQRRVSAIDGSQIYPMESLNISIGLVQGCCMTINYGSVSEKIPSTYETKKKVKCLFPSDFEGYFMHQFTDMHRFKLELSMAEGLSDTFLLIDGSLKLNYLTQINSGLHGNYRDDLEEFHITCQKNKIIPVGYIDSSRSTEISRLIQILLQENNENPKGIVFQSSSDAILLNQWAKKHADARFGDRTCIFHSRVSHPSESPNRICFFYFKASQEDLVRVEFPETMINSIDQIWEVLIAQCLIGNCYPYLIDMCHKEVVLTNRDERNLEQYLQKFFAKQGIRFYFHNKERNKRL
jgi:hypothetical protein